MKKTKTIFTFLLSASFLFMSVGLFGQAVAQSKKKTVKEDYLKKIQEKTMQEDFIRAQSFQPTPAFARTISWAPYESSHLTLRKALSKNSSTKNSKFIIDADQKKIRMSASGSLSEGKISITISEPSGKEFQKIEMDSSADIEWSQTLGLDEENKNYFGEWEFEIVISQATGMYSFSISTF
ncbi:MAG: hypothetical protein IMY71_15355 [Bacteroidetes bacterium]|nr:hypothetical protein [Bacteroidota bacterium]